LSPRKVKSRTEVQGFARVGYIGLPPGPGLSVEVDEKKLEEEAKKPQTYKWPGATLKDGSISDY
jgi:hypothetical protein